jgi:SAM-dependent methyltransferase
MVEKYDVEQFHNHPSPLVRYVERKRISGHLLAQVPSGHSFGIDPTESLLVKAERRLTKRGTLVQGDAKLLPFRDGAWQRVYCSEVLEHLPSPAAALDEMRRIVAHEGVAVVSVPNERLINALKALLRKSGLYRLRLNARAGDYQMPEHMDDEWHPHAFDLAGLFALILGGLRVTHIEGIPFRWLPLRYVVRCESYDQESARRG